MTHLHSFRLFCNGVSNEYRIQEDRIEFRINEGNWRILSDSEIELHYRFNTELARWLRANHFAAHPPMSQEESTGVGSSLAQD